MPILRGTDPLSTDVIYQWTFNGNGTPLPGGPTNARLNPWLFQGHAPSNGQEVEVIVRSFDFIAN